MKRWETLTTILVASVFLANTTITSRCQDADTQEVIIGEISEINQIPTEILNEEEPTTELLFEEKIEYSTPGAIIEYPVPVGDINNTKFEVYEQQTVNGPSEHHLTKQSGVFQGPSGTEKYYNLNMSKCVSIMQSYGYNYEYWVRSDGVKMFGDYVMIATNTYVYPKGTIMETSLGTAIVVDHCVAAERSQMIDICVSWK